MNGYKNVRIRPDISVTAYNMCDKILYSCIRINSCVLQNCFHLLLSVYVIKPSFTEARCTKVHWRKTRGRKNQDKVVVDKTMTYRWQKNEYPKQGMCDKKNMYQLKWFIRSRIYVHFSRVSLFEPHAFNRELLCFDICLKQMLLNNSCYVSIYFIPVTVRTLSFSEKFWKKYFFLIFLFILKRSFHGRFFRNSYWKCLNLRLMS